MEAGDLGQTHEKRLVVILEGVLAVPTYKGVVRQKPMPAGMWSWSSLGIKRIHYYRYRGVPTDVVTFTGPVEAEIAADWMPLAGIEVDSCVYMPFDAFTESLSWRLHDILKVVDSDPNRIMFYGQLGYLMGSEGEF